MAISQAESQLIKELKDFENFAPYKQGFYLLVCVCVYIGRLS